MLKRLEIKNFAIVEHQTLELADGLNVLTGETGAGKSILVEALGFLLGARGSSTWLRAGASKLEVTGWFDDVVIRRELDATGKTRAFIDNQSAPLAQLAALGRTLVDFHGQHEHQTLIRSGVQLDLLDRFGGLEKEAAATATAFDAWDSLRQEAEAAQMSDEERRRRVEFARFQLEELTSAGLQPGEDVQLESELPLLKNAERLRTLASSAYGALYEDEGAALASLSKAARAVADLAKIDPALEPVAARVEELRVSADDVAHELADYRDKAHGDPDKLDKILARLEQLSRLKKKQAVASVDELIASREKLALEVSRLENADARRGELEKELAAATKKLDAACEKLHEARMKAAKTLSAALQKELKPLGMPNAQFAVSVEMEEGRYTRSGADECEFMLAPNPGEPMKPVREIASGGELSRVMLALKTVLAKADRVGVLVFDEVDAGIGGTVARSVGEKLAALGKSHQVLCVTHLPQVACFGAAHFSVAKEVAAGRTRVAVERLDGARRLEAIAVMIGGREATAASRKHAKELLASSTLS